MKKQSQKNRPARGAKNTDRAAVILSLFREFPNNKFSLKHLASASGGATKEGRRETFEILGRLHDEGIVEECAREKYRLTHKHLPHFEGVADMTATGSIYVRVEGEEKDIFVNQRNTANALNGDRVEVVAIHRGRDGKFEGEITRIVERSRKPYVGIAEVGAHQIFVRADSRRMPMDIYLSKRLYPDVKDGQFKTDLEFTTTVPPNIRTGQTYHLNLQLGAADEAILIPRGTFYQSTGGQWIYVLSPDGTEAFRRKIKIGKQNPRYYQVTEGLEPGEKIITSGYEMFGDNERLIFK